MRFLWPEMLWLLFLVPVLVAIWLTVIRRREEQESGLLPDI
jgi:hypothetical protein